MDTTNITLSFPNWFYGILTLGVLLGVFYVGSLHFQIKAICKEYPKIQTSLVRISEILLQKKMSKDAICSICQPCTAYGAGEEGNCRL